MDVTRYSFNVLWYDRIADQDRPYILSYYPDTREIDMYEVTTKRVFLKKCQYPEFNFADCHVGGTITIYSRQLKIVGYANDFTCNALSAEKEATCAIVKPHAVAESPIIIADAIISAMQRDLRISRIRMVRFSENDVNAFYEEHIGKPFFPNLAAMVMAGPACVIELIGPNAVLAWRDIIGPTDPSKCDPEKHLRAKYGVDVTSNAFHGSASKEDADRELGIVFKLCPVAAIGCKNNSVMLIQPKFKDYVGHILVGLVNYINKISPDIYLTGINTCIPTVNDLAEVMAAYQGVIPRWSEYIDVFGTGPCIAIEVATHRPSEEINRVEALRTFAGPFEPKIATYLAPQSVRAVYGTDAINNCVFVTDLPEEAELHADFWFRIMPSVGKR